MCKNGGGGGAGGDVVTAAEYKKLEDENKKLKYRITHLKRALDEKDGGAGAPGKKEKVKFYGTTLESLNSVLTIAELAGTDFDVELVDDETR